ncbi:MAG: phage holin family protein [Coprobacillaceae bacterium]
MNKKIYRVLEITTIIIFILLLTLWNELDHLMTFLIGSMIIDYLLGIYIAIILKNSPNNKKGNLSSDYGYIGLFKKVCILILVWIGHQIDISFQLEVCRNMIIIGYLINEITSINENIIIIGLKKNNAINKVIDILKQIIEDE